MIAALFILYQCQSFATSSGRIYTSTNADKKIAIQEADEKCSLDQEPEDFNSCVDYGCKEVR